jgi:hypothetical protein
MPIERITCFGQTRTGRFTQPDMRSSAPVTVRTFRRRTPTYKNGLPQRSPIGSIINGLDAFCTGRLFLIRLVFRYKSRSGLNGSCGSTPVGSRVAVPMSTCVRHLSSFMLRVPQIHLNLTDFGRVEFKHAKDQRLTATTFRTDPVASHVARLRHDLLAARSPPYTILRSPTQRDSQVMPQYNITRHYRVSCQVNG